MEFLGRGWKFPPQIDPNTGKMMTVSYEEDIKEAVYIILMTRQGERVMMPEFGSKLSEYVYAAMDTSTFTKLKADIYYALTNFEPRIIEVEVDVQPDKAEEGKLLLQISYVVRNTNNPYNLVFPFYLNEGVKNI